MAAIAAPSDSRRWIAVEGIGLAATITVPGVTATIQSLSIDFNGATGGAQAIDWTADVGSLTGTTFAAAPVDVATASGPQQVGETVPIVSVSGTLTLSIGSFVTVTNAQFSLTSTIVSLDLNGDGTADVSGATLLTIGLSDVSLQIGAGGVDFSGHGRLARGRLDRSSFDHRIGCARDSRSWTAIEGQPKNVGLDGVSGLTLTANDLTLDVTTFSGMYTNGATKTAASALNWTTALELNDSGTFGGAANQLNVGGTPISMTAAELAASGTASMNLDGIVSGRVAFSFEQQQVDVNLNGDVQPFVQMSDGTWARGPPTGSQVPTFVGATPTTLGRRFRSGSIAIGARRASVSQASLALAAISPTSSANDKRSWVDVTGQIGSATFAGISGVTLSASNVSSDINEASTYTAINGTTTWRSHQLADRCRELRHHREWRRHDLQLQPPGRLDNRPDLVGPGHRELHRHDRRLRGLRLATVTLQYPERSAPPIRPRRRSAP